MEKIERMHWLYGLDKGTACKCQIYGVKAGPSTDWSADWEACGMRNRSYAGVDIQTLSKEQKDS